MPQKGFWDKIISPMVTSVRKRISRAPSEASDELVQEVVRKESGDSALDADQMMAIARLTALLNDVTVADDNDEPRRGEEERSEGDEVQYGDVEYRSQSDMSETEDEEGQDDEEQVEEEGQLNQPSGSIGTTLITVCILTVILNINVCWNGYWIQIVQKQRF